MEALELPMPNGRNLDMIGNQIHPLMTKLNESCILAIAQIFQLVL